MLQTVCYTRQPERFCFPPWWFLLMNPMKYLFGKWMQYDPRTSFESVYSISANGSLEHVTESFCVCGSPTNIPNDLGTVDHVYYCAWTNPERWSLIISIVLSSFSLSLNMVHYGPIAWIEEELQLNKKENIDFCLAIERSHITLAKIILYIVGLIANLSGCAGFLYLLSTQSLFSTSSSSWCLFLLPFILLQMSQPKWLMFMWHQIRGRNIGEINGVARHCGLGWISFLATSPLTYSLFSLFCFMHFMLTDTYMYPHSYSEPNFIQMRLRGWHDGFTTTTTTVAPWEDIIWGGWKDESESDISNDYVSQDSPYESQDRSYDIQFPCEFHVPANIRNFLNPLLKKAISDVYFCVEKETFPIGDEYVVFSVNNIHNDHRLNMYAEEKLFASVRILAIFFGVFFNVLQILIFKRRNAYYCAIIWLIILGMMGISSEILFIIHPVYFVKGTSYSTKKTATGIAAMYVYVLTGFFAALTPLFLIFWKCFRVFLTKHFNPGQKVFSYLRTFFFALKPCYDYLSSVAQRALQS